MKIDTISQIKARSRKTPLTFGDFVEGVYKTWGKRKAKGVVQLAVALHLIEFRGTDRIVIV